MGGRLNYIYFPQFVIKPIRTWLDIWFSGFNGTVVKAIVSRDRKKFIAKAIIEFGMMMVKNHTKNMPGVKVIPFFSSRVLVN